MHQKKQRQNKVDVVFDFIETAGVELEKRFGISPTCKDMVRYLVERGIIEPKRLRNYMIITDFDRNYSLDVEDSNSILVDDFNNDQKKDILFFW